MCDLSLDKRKAVSVLLIAAGIALMVGVFAVDTVQRPWVGIMLLGVGSLNIIMGAGLRLPRRAAGP